MQEPTLATLAPRPTMNGKPVIEVEATTVINFKSGFSHKLLCDGPTFTTGSACTFTCAYCYVPDIMGRNPHKLDPSLDHAGIVIRRRNPLEILQRQLTYKDGSPKFADPNDQRVVFSSPLVDVAANLVLVRETIESCRLILTKTNWQIRLLSKSSLLPRVAQALGDWPDRVIYGVSTGTLSDGVARAFEPDAPLVSKRIEALRWLQDHGFRTFGMLCPSLPQPNKAAYAAFAQDCAASIRADLCEHVWAEPMNVRGASLLRTTKTLRDAGYAAEADLLEGVSHDGPEWEDYARSTFEAHAAVYANQPGKLRFLQYVSKATRPFWESRRGAGAVVL